MRCFASSIGSCMESCLIVDSTISAVKGRLIPKLNWIGDILA